MEAFECHAVRSIADTVRRGEHLTVERIVYRAVKHAEQGQSFLPPDGVGYGLGEGLGIVLNRLVKGPSGLRTTHRTVVGVVVAEDADHVTIERTDGRRLKLPVSDIIERVALSQ